MTQRLNFQIPANAVAVTEHETNMLPASTVALYIGTGGDLVVDMEGGNTAVTFPSVPSGTIMIGRFVKLRTASTVAGVVALFG